jgi:phage gp37-like protein
VKSLVESRQAIVNTIAQAVSGLAQVYTHGGEFDSEELSRWGSKAPCVIVSILGLRDAHVEGAQKTGMFEMGAFIVTKDQGRLKRDVAALNLLETCLTVISPLQRWGLEDAQAPESIRGRNLFGGKLDSQGVAIWAVTWHQGLDLNVFDPATLDDFLTYHVSYDIAEADETVDAQDTVTLDGPED